MTNLIFFLLILSLFANFSLGSIRYFGLNRSFVLMYKGVLEASCLKVDENGEPCVPYFSKNLLENNVETYLNNNIKRYVDSYTVAFLYFNKDDSTICTSKYCRAVKISIRADINALFHYEKAKNYYVVNAR